MDFENFACNFSLHFKLTKSATKVKLWCYVQ